MAKLITLLAFLTLHIACLADSTNGPAHSPDASKDTIQSTLAAFPDGTEFAIALVGQEETSYLGFKREQGNTVQLENSEAIFEIGSITKVFTTHLMMREVKGGNLYLDKPVQDQFDFKFASENKMTLRQLASHYSGLPSLPTNLRGRLFHLHNPYRKYHREKLEKYLAVRMNTPIQPGFRYKYSNLGMATLGFLMEVHSGKEYGTLLKEQILIPLEMNSTYLDRGEVEHRLVQGYNAKGKPVKYWDLEAITPAGALLSNVSDLEKYARFWMGALDADLSEMMKKQGKLEKRTDVGLGWHLDNTSNGDQFAWHNGGTGGFRSSMAVDPGNDRAVVILTNVGRGELRKKVDQLCHHLLEPF